MIGLYRWQESHQEAEYTNWYHGGPNDKTDFDCVWKSYHKDNAGWEDVNCTWYNFGHGYGEQHALCQIAK